MASVVVIIDNSGSMGSYGYLPHAQSEAASFIDKMGTGDHLGVVKFSDTAQIIFPSPDSAIEAIVDQTTRDAASDSIEKVAAAGNTNMSAAIQRGHELLVSTGGQRAMVMLSDGEWNEGSDPTRNLPDIPIHTIALGHHGQTEVLKQIGKATRATFHMSPTPFDLAEIYFEIVGTAGVARTLANQTHQARPDALLTTQAVVPEGARTARFGASWSDDSVAHTSGPPSAEQISIRLRHQDGTTTAGPVKVGRGYVGLRVGDPRPGTYTVEALYRGRREDLECTLGAFVPDLDLELDATVEKVGVRAGEPIRWTAAVRDGGEVVPGALIFALLDEPQMSPEEAFEAHRERSERLMAARGGDAGQASDNARMLALQTHLGPGERLLPYTRRRVEMAGDRGTRLGELRSSVPGGHIVRVFAEGVSPHTGRAFTLTRRLSVHVG